MDILVHDNNHVCQCSLLYIGCLRHAQVSKALTNYAIKATPLECVAHMSKDQARVMYLEPPQTSSSHTKTPVWCF